MAIHVADTVRLGLANTNRQRDKRLLERQEELDQQAAKVNAALQAVRQTLYDEALVPFRDVFQRLKHVDLIELDMIERPAVGDEVGINLRQPGKGDPPTAVEALRFVVLSVAVPLAAGYVIQAGAYAMMRNFGSASNGKEIRTLYGAAARSATLARFGRGPIAMGGGGMVTGEKALAKLGTTSAGLTHRAIVRWQMQSRQREARDLERRERRMREKQEAAPTLYERGKDMERVLQDVRSRLLKRLPPFTALVEGCDDFTQYDSRQRAEVATMADLYGLAAVVTHCSLVDADGRMSEESGRVLAEVVAQLRSMGVES